MSEKEYVCSYCGKKMVKWQAPEESDWCGEIKFVCFSDECPYYLRGWAHMEEKFGIKVSYRNTVNPQSGREAPLPVASADHLRPGILD